MRILHVVGARPNYMKVAPIMAEMARFPDHFEQACVHTGQHYDVQMSDVFFADLGMPKPDFFLNVGSGTHAEQTARVMLAFEPVVLQYRPDWVVVVGDVNSTLACALVCAKLGVPVAHVEAGLRSGDRSMPEEINRLVTDRLSDLLFTPSADGDANLVLEGIDRAKIHRVGNVMIDSLVRMLPKIQASSIISTLGLSTDDYLLVTLHRPGNVDDVSILKDFFGVLNELSERIPVVFPVHPRTRARLEQAAITVNAGIHLTAPLGYIDFVALERAARLVLTDSGGVQEETTYLGVPCLTMRPNTERPVTVEIGTNRLVRAGSEALRAAVVAELERRERPPAHIPDLWDGGAAVRIVEVFRGLASGK
jgi:UDP-N-acetylglucosamine 2-epimerase (non-hydrolysing)